MPSSKPEGGGTPVPPERRKADEPVDMTDLESVFGKMLEMVDAIEPVDVVSAKIDDESALDPPTNPTRANLEFIEVLRVIHSDAEGAEPGGPKGEHSRREAARSHLSVVRDEPELTLSPTPPPVRSDLNGDADADADEPVGSDPDEPAFADGDDQNTVEGFLDPPSVEDPEGWLDDDGPTETPAPIRGRGPASRISLHGRGPASRSADDSVHSPSLQSFTDIDEDGRFETEEGPFGHVDTEEAPTEETPPMRGFTPAAPVRSRIDGNHTPDTQVPEASADSRSVLPWLLVLGVVLTVAILAAVVGAVLFLT